jgi:hypothetical protein
VNGLRNISGDYLEVSIPEGRSLKHAEVSRELLECDCNWQICGRTLPHAGRLAGAGNAAT